MLEFETRKNDCPICGDAVDMPAEMFATMAEMPRLIAPADVYPREAPVMS